MTVKKRPFGMGMTLNLKRLKKRKKEVYKQTLKGTY
jgi:hypothetical protein